MVDILSKQSFYLLVHREINYPTATHRFEWCFQKYLRMLRGVSAVEVHGTCEPWTPQVSVGP